MKGVQPSTWLKYPQWLSEKYYWVNDITHAVEGAEQLQRSGSGFPAPAGAAGEDQSGT